MVSCVGKKRKEHIRTETTGQGSRGGHTTQHRYRGRRDRASRGDTKRPPLPSPSSPPPPPWPWPLAAIHPTTVYLHNAAAAAAARIGVGAEMAEVAQRGIVANGPIVLAAVLVRADQQAFVTALGYPPGAGHLIVGQWRANGELATKTSKIQRGDHRNGTE